MVTYDAIVTGSSGFIGSHFCRAEERGQSDFNVLGVDLLEKPPLASFPAFVGDVGDETVLRQVLSQAPGASVVHLAAVAEVVMPLASMATLADTNLTATANLLTTLHPQRMIFASSSAVYGSPGPEPVKPIAGEGSAIGAYGLSKLLGELICAQCCAETDASITILRFGNVIGANCRGLIPYLVAHAKRHPEGSVPAQLRGGGKLLRDYVPVESVVEVVDRALEAPLPSGTCETLNVGGIGMTNREVANLVQDVLAEQGYPLRLEFDNPIAPGEATEVVLDVSETTKRLGVKPVTREEVNASIRQSTQSILATQDAV